MARKSNIFVFGEMECGPLVYKEQSKEKKVDIKVDGKISHDISLFQSIRLQHCIAKETRLNQSDNVQLFTEKSRNGKRMDVIMDFFLLLSLPLHYPTKNKRLIFPF
jgi:hypothetical protein